MSIVIVSKWEFKHKHKECSNIAYIQNCVSDEPCWADSLLQKCIGVASSNMEILLLGCLDFLPSLSKFVSSFCQN